MEKKKILSLHSERLENKHRPTIIEFMIDPEDLVYPMIKPAELWKSCSWIVRRENRIMSGTNNGMKKRWISLYVENQVGVLSKIPGLFSGKSYNLDSLTVGTTEDPTVSRMTIATVSDDETFEQIKKQLNRTVEVIKVIDFTDVL